MFAAGFDVERLNPIALSRLSVINLTGNDPAQSLQGNSLNNLLIGPGGAETLIGAGGGDTMQEGRGKDWYCVESNSAGNTSSVAQMA